MFYTMMCNHELRILAYIYINLYSCTVAPVVKCKSSHFHTWTMLSVIKPLGELIKLFQVVCLTLLTLHFFDYFHTCYTIAITLDALTA